MKDETKQPQQAKQPEQPNKPENPKQPAAPAAPAACAPDIRSMFPDELKNMLQQLGEKPFRASQIFQWLHNKHVADYGQMRNIPKTLLAKLEERYPLVTLKKAEEQISKDGTRKYLFALNDGNVIESDGCSIITATRSAFPRRSAVRRDAAFALQRSAEG